MQEQLEKIDSYVFLIATIIRFNNNRRRALLVIIRQVKEITNFRQQQFLSLLHRNHLAQNHQTIPLLAFRRTIIDFRYIFMFQHHVAITTLHDDLFLDVLPLAERNGLHFILRRTHKTLPVHVFKALRNRNKIRHRINAEHKQDSFVVPAIKMFRL